MTLQSALQIALTLLIGALISIPVVVTSPGRNERKTFLDPVCDRIDISFTSWSASGSAAKR